MTGGSCSGTVIVTYNNGTNGNSTVLIPVMVDISTTATPLLTITPPFGFGVVTASTGSSAIQSQISINSTDGSAIPFSATVSQSSGATPWLSLLGSSTGVTQQNLTVQISPSGLPTGVYNGSITIHATNSANLPSGDVTLPVVLTVSTNTTVAVSPTSLTFKQAQGASVAPAQQTITLTATGGSTTFTASTSAGTGGNWLQINPLSGTASGTITASIALSVSGSLSPGTYNSNIVLQFQNSATPTTTIPVTLIVTPAQLVTVTPASLNFSYALGAAAPATQTLTVVSTGGPTTISVGSSSSNPSGWLSVTPTTGTTGTGDGSPLTLTVSVAPAVFTTTGTFTGTITITPLAQSPITVNVTVTVTGVPVPQPSSISNSASGVFGVIAPGELITIKGTNLGPTTGVSFSPVGNTVNSTLSGVQVLFDNIPGTPTYVSATQINVVVPYEIAGRTTTNIMVSNQNQLSAGISQSLAGQAPGIYTFSATGAGQAAVLNQNGTYNGPSAGLVINGQTIGTTPAAAGQVIAVYMTGGGQTSPTSTTGTVTPVGATLYKIPGTVTATINGVPASVQFSGDAPGLVTGVIQVNILVPTGVSGSGLPLAITINGSTSVVGPTIAVQ
jgi:uncharacterized protein (TIGR03437 family)